MREQEQLFLKETSEPYVFYDDMYQGYVVFSKDESTMIEVYGRKGLDTARQIRNTLHAT